MTLSELFAALEADEAAAEPRFAGVDPFVARTALAMLTKISGLPLAAIDMPPRAFSIRFPKSGIPAEAASVFGRNLQQYQSWRRIILDAWLLATRRRVDDDPWDCLRRVTRLTLGEAAANALYALSSRMDGLGPELLTFELAVAIQDALDGYVRLGVRRACRVMWELHDHELARDLGILPPRFGPLPEMGLRDLHEPMPPKLTAFAATQEPGVAHVVDHCWTLAVRACLIPADADPEPDGVFSPEIWRRIATIDPGTHDLSITRESMEIYLGRLARALIAVGVPDPRVRRCDADWRDLMAAVKGIGGNPNRLTALSAPAKAEGRSPSDLSPEWISAFLADAAGTDRHNPARSTCMFLDGLRDDPRIDARLLPPAPSGIIRKRVTGGTAGPPPEDPVRSAWTAFLAAARAEGVDGNLLAAVAGLAEPARRKGLRPADLDADALLGIQGRRTLQDLQAIAGLLDDLRRRHAPHGHLAGEPIGVVTRKRPDPNGPPEAVRDDLDALLAEQGAADSTRRAAASAVKALYAAAGRPAGSLRDLLHLDPDALDWSASGTRAKAHRLDVARLAAFAKLPWTPGWTALQRAAVAAGVAMVDNPVPALLAASDGRGPADLDRTWAEAIDRRHRAAGRADLARTFEAALARLDRLHDLPSVSVTGLLPPEFGPLR